MDAKNTMGGGYGQKRLDVETAWVVDMVKKGDFSNKVLEENTRPFNTQALDLKVVLLHSPRNHAKSLGYA